MKNDKEEQKFRIESEGRNWFRTLLVTVAFVLLIVVVTAFFAARTEVIRGKVEEWLESKTGMGLIIASTRLGWPCDLVVEGLESEPVEGGVALAEVNAKELRIGVSWNMAVRVVVRSGRLVLQKTDDAEWKPRYFARLGDLRNVEQLGVITQKMRKKVRLAVTGASIYWMDLRGNRLARVEDLDFSVSPVKLDSGRELHHCSLSAYLVAWEQGNVTQNLVMEWFFTEQNQFIEVSSSMNRSMPAESDGP